MAGTKLPLFLLPQSVAITFTIGIFFGFFLITASFANRWLIFTDDGWKVKRNIHWFMVIMTNILAALVTAGVGLLVHTPVAETSFVEQGHRPSEYVSPPWDAIVKCTIVNTIALLADVVLMYRLWIVHQKRMVILWFPIFLWVGGIVCTILQIFLQTKHINNPDFGPYQWAAVNMDVGPGIALTPFWASTIALNAYCTSGLVWRIWLASKKGESKSVSRQLRFLVRILMESGALYLSISLAHFFVWFGRDNFAIHMLGAMNSIVIGISHNLIIIRTAQNRAEGEEIRRRTEDLTTMGFNSRPMITVQYTSSMETDERTMHNSSNGKTSK